MQEIGDTDEFSFFLHIIYFITYLMYRKFHGCGRLIFQWKKHTHLKKKKKKLGI
jgi:hypothetical protein